MHNKITDSIIIIVIRFRQMNRLRNLLSHLANKTDTFQYHDITNLMEFMEWRGSQCWITQRVKQACA